MLHQNRPNTVIGTVHAASFPIYGLADSSLDFSLCSYGLGILSHNNVMSVTLAFANPRYSKGKESLTVISLDALAATQKEAPLFLALNDPCKGRFTEKEKKQAGNAFTWEGVLTVGDIEFSAQIRHWKYPLYASTLILKSNKTYLLVNAYGLDYNELIHVLNRLQIINGQEALLKQYQYEFDNQPYLLSGI